MKKICEICGNTFESKSRLKYCKRPIERVCIVCGKQYSTICHPRILSTCDNSECKRKSGLFAMQSTLRICRTCGKSFYPKSSRQLDCGDTIIKNCLVCGNPFNSKCGLRWNTQTCSNPECQKQYMINQQQSFYKNSKKICIWCGKEFTPINNTQKLCGEKHIQICKVCGREFEVEPDFDKDNAPKCCSDDCRHKAYQTPHPQTLESIEKAKKTKIKKYGEDYGAKIWAKSRETLLKRTGYNYPVQNPEVHKQMYINRTNNVANDGSLFDSSYERDFYNFLLSLGDLVQVNTQIPIKFNYQNKSHITLIDFKVNNILLEVKGAHLLEGIYDYDQIIPIEKKLDVYKDNNVVVITNKTDKALQLFDTTLVGLDIALFEQEISDPQALWQKILQHIENQGGFLTLENT